MKLITVWKSLETDDNTKEKTWVHHHIEDGHSRNDKPTPLKDDEGVEFKTQKGWKSKEWQKEFALLDDNHVVVRPKF